MIKYYKLVKLFPNDQTYVLGDIIEVERDTEFQHKISTPAISDYWEEVFGNVVHTNERIMPLLALDIARAKILSLNK